MRVSEEHPVDGGANDQGPRTVKQSLEPKPKDLEALGMARSGRDQLKGPQ